MLNSANFDKKKCSNRLALKFILINALVKDGLVARERYGKDGGEGKANMALSACWSVFALLYPAALKSQKVN